MKAAAKSAAMLLLGLLSLPAAPATAATAGLVVTGTTVAPNFKRKEGWSEYKAGLEIVHFFHDYR